MTYLGQFSIVIQSFCSGVDCNSSYLWPTPAPFVPLWTLSQVTPGCWEVSVRKRENEPPLWSPELGGWEALCWEGTWGIPRQKEHTRLLAWRSVNGGRNSSRSWEELPGEDKEEAFCCGFPHLICVHPKEEPLTSRSCFSLQWASCKSCLSRELKLEVYIPHRKMASWVLEVWTPWGGGGGASVFSILICEVRITKVATSCCPEDGQMFKKHNHLQLWRKVLSPTTFRTGRQEGLLTSTSKDAAGSR